MRIFIKSFGTKYSQGLQSRGQVHIDATVLRNPHGVKELKDLNGRDPRIIEYLAGDPQWPEFWDAIMRDVHMMLATAAKSFLITVSCYGGRHRSVAVATLLARALRATGYEVHLTHREEHRWLPNIQERQ